MFGTAQAEATLVKTVAIDEATLEMWLRQGRDFKAWTFREIALGVERVNRGAALLDQVNPSWMEKVAPDHLSMQRSDFCIIGQAYGNYDSDVGIPFGMEVVVAVGISDELNEKAIEHGFMENGVPFALLDRIWVYLLIERREQGERVLLEVPA